MAAREEERRGSGRPAQPREHPARVGAQRPDNRADARARVSDAAVPRWFEPMKAVLAGQALLRSRLDLRAQARRHPLHGHPRRRRGAAALAHATLARRPLSGDRRGARGRPVRALRRRRGGRGFRERDHQLLPPPARGHERRGGLPVRLRRRAPGRRGHRRAAAARAQGAAAEHARVRGARPLQPAPQRAGRGDVPRGLPQGPRGGHRQARRPPYRHGRSRDWLKLKCSHEQELVVGGFTAPQGSRTEFGALLVGYYERRQAALRRQGRHRLRPRARSRELGGAPARAREWTLPRSTTSSRCRAARTGHGRSSWRRSASPSGRATAACATRGTWACATTSRPRGRARSGRREREDLTPGEGHVPRSGRDEGRSRRLLRAGGRAHAAHVRGRPVSMQRFPGRHRRRPASSTRTYPTTSRTGSRRRGGEARRHGQPRA